MSISAQNNYGCWQLRDMVSADLPTVVAIEQQCHARPWTLDQFAGELANPLAHIHLCIVGAEIAGYLCFWDVCGEVEIHNVVTAPQWRRQGVAVFLMEHLRLYMQDQHLDCAFLEVRRSNYGAIALYENFLFQVTATRRGYYCDGEDALLMEWRR